MITDWAYAATLPLAAGSKLLIAIKSTRWDLDGSSGSAGCQC
jgi:hypothetical protein